MSILYGIFQKQGNETEKGKAEVIQSQNEETEEQFLAQAKKYFSIFMFLRNLDTQGGGSANITNVTLFGLKDHYTPGDTTNARLFDTNFQLKEAFTRVKAILNATYKKLDQ